MRVFVLIIFLFSSISSFSQDIIVDNLEYDNTPLKEVFFDLSRKFQVSISYSSDKVTLHTPISLQVGTADLATVLSSISDQANLSFLKIGDQIVFKDKSISADVAIKDEEQPQPRTTNQTVLPKETTREPIVETTKKEEILASKESKIQVTSSEIATVDPQKVDPEVSIDAGSQEGARSVTHEAVLVPQEIHSLSGGLSGTQIVLSALGNSKRVFHSNTLKLHGFFREVILQNNNASWLVESIVDVLDPGYREEPQNRNKTNEEVFISQTRSSFNYLYPEIVPNLESFNSLDAMLKWNPLKYPNEDLQKRLLNNQYHIADEFTLNGKDFLVITYEEETSEMILKETYTIEKGVAIVKRYEKNILAKEGYYLDNEFKLAGDKQLIFRLKEDMLYYEFESFQGKQYLSKAGGKGSADIYDSKTKKSVYRIGIERFLDINDVRRSRIKRKGKGHMDKSKNLHLQLTKYDETVWFDEQISNKYPLDESYLRPLQREVPLEMQFGSN